MRLETMEPNPSWDAASYEEALEVLGRDGLAFKVWGGDWCKDCRRQLPDFAAALDAAGVPDERIEHYPVEKDDDGNKVGPRVDEYDIEYIPTVVVERVAQSATDGSSGAKRRSHERTEQENGTATPDRSSASRASGQSPDERSEGGHETLEATRNPRADGDGTDSRGRDGDEVARFVEEEPVSIAVYLADQLR